MMERQQTLFSFFKSPSFFFGFLACALLPLVIYNNLVLHLKEPLDLLHGDSYLVNFIFKHYFSVFQSGRWDELSTLPMFYGFQNSLFYSDHHLIHALLSFPLYLLTGNVIETTNMYVLFTVTTSSVAMYLFLWHLTKNALAGVLGAVVFVCNPFITARFPDHLILLSLQWIPLTFLFFERLLEKRRRSDGFLMLFFLTCQLLSSLYYIAFLSLILPLYMAIRLVQTKTNPIRLVNIGVLAGGIVFGTSGILSAYFYLKVFGKESINRSLETSIPTYAARVSDYLFTAPNNVFYGGLKEHAEKAFPAFVRMGIWSEHNLFWGVTVFALFVISFLVMRKTEKKGYWLLCVGFLLLCILLSFGSRIVITDSLVLPGPYTLFYYLDPLLQFIRTTARFGVFVFFFLSIVVSMTMAQILLGKSALKRTLLGGVVLLLVVLEYHIQPLSYYKKDTGVSKFYEVINNDKKTKVILNLPIGNLISYQFRQARAEDLDAHYLLYAVIYHNKTLFNGYTGFLPKEYYQRGQLLSLNFPTTAKLTKLRVWGVDTIILHREEFNVPSDYDVLRSALLQRGLPIIAETDGLVAFAVKGR